MPSTKKTSGGGTTKRGTAAKRSTSTTKRTTSTKRGTSASTAAKRKTGTKITAQRGKAAASGRRTTTAPKGSRVFKLKLLATLVVCVAIVVLAVLGTVFYDKLVPEKKPVTAKSPGIEVVQPTQTPPPTTNGIKPDKTPASTDKPDGVTVTEPTQPATQTPPVEPAKPEPLLVAQASPKTPAATEPADTQPKATVPDSGKPKLALIFDDVGYDAAAAKKLQDLKLPLTFSILPYSPHGQSIAKSLPSHIEIMVHVPMQAINGDSDKEQGLLRSDMTEAELAQTLRADIDRIPNAKGINNHTGSKLTQQVVPMQVVMLVLKEKNMFFVDSVTSDKSVAKSAAEMLLVPNAARNVFLDHVADVATIKAQLYRAVNLAKQNGSAVAIGHPRPLTLEVVLQELPKIAKANEIELVHASTLVK